MAKEVKTKKSVGVKIESIISKPLHKKLKKLAKKDKTSIAQFIRDWADASVG